MASGPLLTLAGRAPLSVRGTGFEAGERVAVTVTVGGAAATETVDADARGTFVAAFTGLAVDRLARPRIVARAARTGAVEALLPHTGRGPR